MFVLITSASDTTDPMPAAVYSLLGYVWFLLTTKLDLKWNLAIIFLIIIGFIYENIMRKKEKNIMDDQALDEVDKQKIRSKHNKNKMIIFISILLITLLGTLQYYMKKRGQYGVEFNITKFIFAYGKKHRPTKYILTSHA